MDLYLPLGGDKDGDCGSQKPMVELQWYHVAIASVLILVNGNQKNFHYLVVNLNTEVCDS
jgi:hypothetical protein